MQFFLCGRRDRSQDIPQGEGTPHALLLFGLSLHRSLQAANGRLVAGKFLSAFLDDVCAVCTNERVWAVHQTLEQELRMHCSILGHHGKTQISAGCDQLTRTARIVDPTQAVSPWLSGTFCFRARCCRVAVTR